VTTTSRYLYRDISQDDDAEVLMAEVYDSLMWVTRHRREISVLEMECADHLRFVDRAMERAEWILEVDASLVRNSERNKIVDKAVRARMERSSAERAMTHWTHELEQWDDEHG